MFRRLVPAVVAASGVGFTLLAATPAHTVLPDLFGWVFWTAPEPALGLWGRLGLAIAGAVMAGWGVSLHEVLAGRPERAVAAGVITWFVVDSAASLALGAVGNVGVNVAYLVPLLWSARRPLTAGR